MSAGRLLLQHIYHAKKRDISQFQISSPISALTLWSKNYDEEKYEDTDDNYEPSYADVPRPRKKWDRKPYPTPMKELIQRAKEEKRVRMENPCHVLEHSPENGLLVSELIEVAHQVYNANELFLRGVSKLVDGEFAIPIKKCRFCPEVHIGHHGHEIRSCEGHESGSRSSFHVWRRGGIRDVVGLPYCYHLFDRVGKPRVGHKERFGVPRLPAITELCIQAGVDLDDYPTKRRTKPVYSVEGRIVDFELEKEEVVVERNFNLSQEPKEDMHAKKNSNQLHLSQEHEEEMTRPELSKRTLQAWLEMRSKAKMIMKKYSVITCGYCPEIQVGPNGHKVRMCKAAKHQFRDGQHAWQEATIDDLIRPNYVWHVRNADGPPLANDLKRYYGKAPAIVELCVQAGAPVPNQYRSMMRLDIVPPDLDEHDLVA